MSSLGMRPMQVHIKCLERLFLFFVSACLSSGYKSKLMKTYHPPKSPNNQQPEPTTNQPPWENVWADGKLPRKHPSSAVYGVCPKWGCLKIFLVVNS